MKKGKGPGKKKGRVISGESGPGEDRSWGSEVSNLRQEIQRELGAAGTEGSMETVAEAQGFKDLWRKEALPGTKGRRMTLVRRKMWEMMEARMERQGHWR